MDYVNILCDDILQIIFKQASEIHSSLKPLETNISGAVRLTQVCRRWRDVARKDLLLWTTLDGSKPREIEWCLPLSKNAPIHFFFSNPPSEPKISAFPQSVSLVVPHLSRLRSLTLGGQWGALRILLDILTPSHVPQLETLHLTPSPTTSLGTRVNHLLLPEVENTPLFTMNFPRIKHIRFDNHAPSLKSPIWNARDSIYLNVSPSLPPNVLKELFSHSPNLRILSLSYSFSLEVRLSRHVPSIPTPIRHLEKLTMFTDLESISVFIETFLMPKLSMLNLFVWDLNLQRSLQIAFSHGTQRLRLLENIVHLKLEASDSKMNDNTMGRRLKGHDALGEQILYLEFGRYSPLAFQGMLELFRNVETLTIAGDFADVIWDIGTAPSMRTLRMERATSTHTLEELVHRQCFPYLERLELSDVSFFPGPTIVLPLLANSGSPSLRMSHCRVWNQIPADILERYRTSGITIEWIAEEGNSKHSREAFPYGSDVRD